MFKGSNKLVLTTVLILLIVTSGFILNPNKINAVANLTQETLEVKVKIDPTHQFNLLSKPVVNFEYPWSGAEKGEALLLKKAVTSEIISNASWNLAVNNRKLTEFTVLIKRSDQNRDGWQQISNQTAYFSGANGRQKVAFDIKIMVPKAEQISESGRKSLSLGFTISH